MKLTGALVKYGKHLNFMTKTSLFVKTKMSADAGYRITVTDNDSVLKYS